MANGTGTADQPTAQTGRAVDPFRAYNFELRIEGVTEGHFTQCNGLGIRVEDIQYREGGASQIVHRLPGRVEYGDITLKYGLTATRTLWDWFMATVNGAVDRKHVTVVMYGNDGVTPVITWDLLNAWPAEWSGAPLDALCQEIAIESLRLVFDELKRG